MSDLDRSLVKYLTKLSRIHCSNAEEEALLDDLKKILNYVEELQELETENVKPCNNVLEGMINVMREDEVGETLPRDLFLANTPEHTGGLVRVPPVISKNS